MDAEKLTSLTAALEYIENNLTSGLTQEGCARYACCSLSGLQKMFRNVFHTSVGGYVTKRRVTAAAKELQKRERSVLDIALEYGWGSAEAFTRAFSRVWGMTPTEYRRRWRFSGLCPKLDIPRRLMYKGEFIMTNKYDISELYDYIKSMQGTYVLSFDIACFGDVNKTYGSDAGDKVIVECLHRIDRECTDGMMMFRIGGDEFVMMTGLSDREAAEALALNILSRNSETVEWKGAQIPVRMRAGAVLLKSGKLSYSELFSELVSAPSPTAGEVKF